MADNRIFEFGPFRLDVGEQQLLRDGAAVPLTPRAFGTLLALITRCGRLVTREELMAEVWGHTIVEDGNLTLHISMLRKALGEDAPDGVQYIETVPRRGYRFTAAVVERSSDARPVAPDGSKTFRRSMLFAGAGLIAALVMFVAARIWFSESSDLLPSGLETSGPLSGETGDRPVHGIAVLPFVNLSPDPDNEYLADGIAEELLNMLARIEGLRVVSRTSAFSFKGKNTAVPEIARRLGVAHVLEGSVRKQGMRVRITAQLIDTGTDDHLWLGQYDRELSDIFTVQEEIAANIAEALQLHLTEQDRLRLARRGTDNPKAYDRFLKGRMVLFGGDGRTVSTPAGVQAIGDEAEHWFRAALAEDPDYADATAGLARALLDTIDFYPLDERARRYESAMEAAQRAIMLAPDLAAGHLALGRAYSVNGQGDAALEQYRIAAGLEPDNSEALDWLATIHANQGRLPEAVSLLERTLVFDPGQPGYRDGLARYYERLGELERARREYHRAWEEFTPHPGRLECALASVSLREDRSGRARTHIEQMLTLEPDGAFALNCAIGVSLSLRDFTAAAGYLEANGAYTESATPVLAARVVAGLGDSARLEQLLQAAERQLQELPRAWGSALEYDLGVIAALRGDGEQALAHLERSVEQGWRSYRELALDSAWDAVRDNPRFRALEEQIESDLAQMRAELGAGSSTSGD